MKCFEKNEDFNLIELDLRIKKRFNVEQFLLLHVSLFSNQKYRRVKHENISKEKADVRFDF